MPRAFIPSDVLQSTTGFSPATTATPGVSLPNPATEGSAGFVVIGSQGQVTPPWEWHEAALSGISAGVNELAILIRPDLEDQEQSWVFNAGAAPVPTGVSGSSAFWAWLVEEWANVSYAPMQGSASAVNSTGGVSSLSIGPTGSFTAQYVIGVAAVMILGSASSTAWPTGASWSGGFTETDVVSEGTGTTANDIQLRIARQYGTLNDAGPWSTTCTFTGSMTGLTPWGAMAVFQAEDFDSDQP
jgi:hypothetical protein